MDHQNLETMRGTANSARSWVCPSCNKTPTHSVRAEGALAKCDCRTWFLEGAEYVWRKSLWPPGEHVITAADYEMGDLPLMGE